MPRIDPIFLSHGAPGMLQGRSAARGFLADLGRSLPRPRAILVASAHWESGMPAIGAAEAPATLHDLCAGAPEVCRLTYPAPGSPALARRAAGLLRAAGLPAALDPERGLDHGAWVPLRLMLPAADVPVVPLSVQPRLGPRHHLMLGRALAPLVEEGVLVVGSGGVTNNVHACHGRREDAPAEAWAMRFRDWLTGHLTEGDFDALAGALERAPARRENHPTPEHLMPLFVAIGAAGRRASARLLHASVTHGVLAMDAYAFPAAAPAPAARMTETAA
ncbi:dioxygenase [Allostella sp. ATCC 35155]|nr:dioxygenase [Stella sp. ATCC 35155]